MKVVRIAVPQPTSRDASYNQRCWPQYAHAIHSCGGVAVPIPLGESQATVAHTISGCCGILLPGSPADLNPQKYGQEPEPECAPPDPDREAVDELLLQDAFNLQKPIFGICYGLQALNVWRNGTLRQHIHGTVHEQSTLAEVHRIDVRPDSKIAAMLARSSQAGSDAVQVNSSHHQSALVPGDGLAVVGVCEDDDVIEALELTLSDQFVVGVQWHPERTFGVNAFSRALFESFVSAASAWKLKPIQDSVLSAR
jgi:putative glutamine amidotransferase